MNEPNDFELTEAVRETALEILRESKVLGSRHLEVDVLVDYQEGRLSEQERVQIESHLSTCPECAEELAELAVFDNEVEGSGTEPATQVAWENFQSRVRNESPESDWKSVELSGPVLPKSQLQPLWSAAAGFAAALLLGYFIWSPEAPERIADRPMNLSAVEAPVLVDLEPDSGSPSRGGELISVPNSSDVLILRLLLGDLTDHGEYLVEISSSTGETVWQQTDVHRQKSGFFVVLVPLKSFSRGSYQLRLADADSPETALAVYSFELQREE